MVSLDADEEVESEPDGPEHAHGREDTGADGGPFRIGIELGVVEAARGEGEEHDDQRRKPERPDHVDDPEVPQASGGGPGDRHFNDHEGEPGEDQQEDRVQRVGLFGTVQRPWMTLMFRLAKAASQ